jgi:hypothetical protein
MVEARKFPYLTDARIVSQVGMEMKAKGWVSQRMAI